MLEGLEADQERSQQQIDGLANELQLKDSQLSAMAEENASLAERLAEQKGQAQQARDQLGESSRVEPGARPEGLPQKRPSAEHQRSAPQLRSALLIPRSSSAKCAIGLPSLAPS